MIYLADQNSNKKPANEEKTENGNEEVNLAMEHFQWMQNDSIRLFLKTFALAVLFFAIVVYVMNLADIMYLSGIVAVGLSLLAFLVLMQLIPGTLRSLWNLGNVAGKYEKNKKEGASLAKNLAPLDEQYLTFIKEFQSLLNHKLGQLLMGIMCAIIFTIWHRLYGYYEDYAVYALESSAFFVVGLMAWRMIVVGWEIRKLTIGFNLKAQLEHPDGCGGLSSLGYLCLWNTIILAVPGTFFGGWILIWPRFGPDYDFTRYFYALLFIITLLGLMAFFWPLYCVHGVLKHNHDAAARKLYGIGKLITQLEEELHKKGELDSEEEDKRRQLDILRKKYDVLLNYPTWPFNTKILRQLALSEIVPLMSLASLGQPLQDIVNNIVKFIK